MNAEQIVRKAREQKAAFGECKCRKLAGAVSVEVVRAALSEAGIHASARDVFVRGIPVEADLVISRTKQRPPLGLIYEVEQVGAVLEIKTSGCYGESSLEKLKRDYQQFRKHRIPYAYVSLEDRENYRHRPSTKRLGLKCFTLAWHQTTGGQIEPTGDWGKLLEFLRKCLQVPHAG